MMCLYVLLLVGLLQIQSTLCADCACATGGVNVRDGAGTTHANLTSLEQGQCLTFKGNRQTVNGDSWVNVDYNGRDAWIHGGFVSITPCGGSAGSNSVQLPGCPRIITRAEWGARPHTRPPIRFPQTPRNVYIHHSGTEPCHIKAHECKYRVHIFQSNDIFTLGWSSIGNNFFVGEDGYAYEARGWDEVDNNTLHHNYDGLVICVIGDFTNRVPNDAALNTVQQLIECGVANGKLTQTYTLKGHRDVEQTSCPGQKLYELIQQWPHYHS